MFQLSGAHFHFVGIGGIGMCGLAELMHSLGAKVTGSDLSQNAQTRHLESLGVKVYLGHEASQVGDATVVVFSSAVKAENPELKAARRVSIPVIPRAEALAEIMNIKRGIAIAGTHGKTTTTSLCASVFLDAKVDPTIAVGGRLDVIKSTAKLGSGEWMIVEADESDGSFQKLSPEILVITNIDDDHVDYYGCMDNLYRAFYDFALKTPFYGSCIVCGDDPQVRQLFEDFPKKIIFYGQSSHNDFQLHRKGELYFLTSSQGEELSFSPSMPGDHNALNGVAAILAAAEAGLSLPEAAKSLSRFAGVDRRFQRKGAFNGVEVYDDYGHHPTEIRTVLSAFREKYSNKKIAVLFQPHRFSRLKSCWKDFTNCFVDIDYLGLLPVYAAGEKPIPQATSQILASEILGLSQVKFLEDFDSAHSWAQEVSGPCSVFITLGAGDVYKVGEELCK